MASHAETFVLSACAAARNACPSWGSNETLNFSTLTTRSYQKRPTIAIPAEVRREAWTLQRSGPPGTTAMLARGRAAGVDAMDFGPADRGLGHLHNQLVLLATGPPTNDHNDP